MIRVMIVLVLALATLCCDSTQEGPLEGMQFVSVPAGSFQMGSPVSESGRVDWMEKETQHMVTLREFEIMTTEVTQGMWEEVMGETIHDLRSRADYDSGLAGVGGDYPMYYVSWEDCQEFIDRINTIDSNYFYRLPTEAEWEYAVRAGTTTRFYWGDDPSGNEIESYAWVQMNSDGTTHPVASKSPNDWGLYDTIGNVGEWCEDVYAPYEDDHPLDGTAFTGGYSYFRVIRGGSWDHYATEIDCRSASRIDGNLDWRADIVGFRLVRIQK